MRRLLPGVLGRAFSTLPVLVGLAACQHPPAAAIVGGGASAEISLGQNAVGETCTQDGGRGASGARILCGTWDQPAAEVTAGGMAGSAGLATALAGSSWRVQLDRRVACDDAVSPSTILGEPALVLHCRRRVGGWPHLALATIIDGRIWYADGVEPALPAMERSIGVLSGRLSGNAVASHAISPALAAQRLAGAAFSASDVGQYEAFMHTAAGANRAGNYAEAENAYNSVAELQRRVQGANSPALARTLAGEALQASNLSHYQKAEKLFIQAWRLARDPAQTDENAQANVLHAYGLHQLNEHRADAALTTLQASEADFRRNLHGAPLLPGNQGGRRTSLEVSLQSTDLLGNAPVHAALSGVVETQRAEAVALERLNRLDEGAAIADSASRIAVANGLNQPGMDARLLRTSAFIEEARGHGGIALASLENSANDFALAVPDSPAFTRTTLLVAQRQAAGGNHIAGLATCRAAIAALRSAKLGAEPALLIPCLDLLSEAAGHAQREAANGLRAEMFEAAELAQGSETSQEIAEASARLAVNARDPRVAALMKERADLNAKLTMLSAEREVPEASTGHGADAGLAAQILGTRTALAEKSSALQAAAPNYDSLVQSVVGARDVLSRLRPGEAFLSIVLGPHRGWSFLLRDGSIAVAPVDGGAERMAALVAAVRKSLDAQTSPPPPFNTAAAADIYAHVLGSFGPQLDGATSLIVAPSGPLLSLPFALLLTGPARPDALASAPWLVQRLVISHVPAPANFVSLRKLVGTSRATRPWFGFGDFRPVALAQATASFPPANCGPSARELAGLPPLPGAIRELETVRRVTGAAESEQLLGPDFTAEAVLRASLKDTRILHFATHAILASDLKCQTEPALVTSAPASAPDAGAALLTASEITQLSLDADAVILSACNTGGGSGMVAAESLSGLARSFFYAGARSLLVTHWDVNDAAAAYLVAKTILNSKHDPSIGMAGALAAAQRSMIADNAVGHPFYWAPLALIGEGQGGGSARTAMR